MAGERRKNAHVWKEKRELHCPRAQLGYELDAIDNLAAVGFLDRSEEGCLVFPPKFERFRVVGSDHSDASALFERCPVDYDLSCDDLSGGNSHRIDTSGRGFGGRALCGRWNR